MGIFNRVLVLKEGVERLIPIGFTGEVEKVRHTP